MHIESSDLSLTVAGMQKKMKIREKCVATRHLFLTPIMQGLADAAQHKVEKQHIFIQLFNYYIVPTPLKSSEDLSLNDI